LLEAAACGRPLITTDTPGCRDAARDGINGFLVPPDDPDKLADAIDRLANDAELRRAFGQRSREIAVEEFSSERVGREIVQLYQRLLEMKPGG
jgi:glycosyltransferase involved in cell wall biosynthesis